jgi:hypothetical protein
MTEAEWQVSGSPEEMLAWFLPRNECRDHARWRASVGFSERKLRLFACACARAMGVEGRAAAEIILPAELLADGDESLLPLKKRPAMPGVEWCYAESGARAAERWAEAASLVPRAERAALMREVCGNPFRPVTLPMATGKATAPLVVEGKPTGMVATVEVPRCPWLTPMARVLAQAAYDSGKHGDGTLDPLTLMALADRLEEEGCVESKRCVCDDGLIHGPLDSYPCYDCKGTGHLHNTHPLVIHLRSPGPHVRGCWAVDLILGKG